MENQILYGVGTSHDETGKIFEYIVVKETPKTYIVKEKTNNSTWERTVKKSQMSVGSLWCRKLIQSYSEAIEFAKHYIQARINGNIKRIEDIKATNKKLAERLKELEGDNERT